MGITDEKLILSIKYTWDAKRRIYDFSDAAHDIRSVLKEKYGSSYLCSFLRDGKQNWVGEARDGDKFYRGVELSIDNIHYGRIYVNLSVGQGDNPNVKLSDLEMKLSEFKGVINEQLKSITYVQYC